LQQRKLEMNKNAKIQQLKVLKKSAEINEEKIIEKTKMK
jgi:hypothetical protein